MDLCSAIFFPEYTYQSVYLYNQLRENVMFWENLKELFSSFSFILYPFCFVTILEL